MPDVTILELPRGPTIAGTRITVYTILEYLDAGDKADEIAGDLELSSQEVAAAVDYIHAHESQVRADHAKIMERLRRGNPPEVQQQLDESLARLPEKAAAIRKLMLARNGRTHASSSRCWPT